MFDVVVMRGNRWANWYRRYFHDQLRGAGGANDGLSSVPAIDLDDADFIKCAIQAAHSPHAAALPGYRPSHA
jgi:hypothetical protein